MIRGSSIGESSLGLGGLEAQPMDPVVPVFKVAVALVKECLWKGQVRIPQIKRAYRLLQLVSPNYMHNAPKNKEN